MHLERHVWIYETEGVLILLWALLFCRSSNICFLKSAKISEFPIFESKLFHSVMVENKNF